MSTTLAQHQPNIGPTPLVLAAAAESRDYKIPAESGRWSSIKATFDQWVKHQTQCAGSVCSEMACD